jgi:Ca2+ transporting ATPase
MEDERLTSQSYGSFIRVDDLKELVDQWLQRETGSEELDTLIERGGYNWIQRGLKTDIKEGIDEASAEEREHIYGNNKVEKVRLKTFWEHCKEALEDFILRILIVAGIADIVLELIIATGEREIAWIEGFAILVSVFIVTVVTAGNNLKKEKEFAKLNQEAESGKKITIIRNGKVLDQLGNDEVLVGDLVVLKGGMEIAGDGLVVEGFSLQLDESSMTGETKPMSKDSIENCNKKKIDIIRQKGVEKLGHHEIPSPIILSGTKVLNGNGMMIVINVGKNSSIGKIKEIMASGEAELTPLQMKLEKIARDIGFFGLIAAIVILFVLILRYIIENSIEGGEGWGQQTAPEHIFEVLQYFLISVTILVVAIPEGLPLAVTLSLAYSVKKMMQDNNLVRKLQACETMGGANIICSDKTGTLTRNEMYWTHFWNGKEIKIFDSEKDTALPMRDYLESCSVEIFIDVVVFNSLEDPKKKDGNPTEMALLRYLDKSGVDVLSRRLEGQKLFGAPFSSDRKRMSTIIKHKNGKCYAFIKGASEYMIEISNSFHNTESGQITPLDNESKKLLEGSIENMAKKALRTIGIAYKEVDPSKLDLNQPDDRGIFAYEKDGFTIIGICGIKDVIRPEVPVSVAKCHKAGIDVKMVTGDNKITARAIAREVNIINDENEDTALVMEGPEFLRRIEGIICANCRDLSVCTCVKNENELSKAENKGKKIRKDTIKNQEEFDKIWKQLAVLARSRPEDKYALVIGLRERGNVVAVTGDGTNDAPALSKADVGFAMGISGTEVAKQAASILILDDNFSSIVQAVKWGRNIYDSIKKFLVFQLTVNIVAVITTFISAVILKEAILSTVQLLWINLIMDTLAALALATEPPSEELLNRKPYKKTDYIITPTMMKMILGQSVLQIAVLLIFVFLGEHFLFDIIGQRQLQIGQKTIVPGRVLSGFDKSFYRQFSVHYTYNFNVFVMLQFFNFFNARILDNSLNIFKGITKSNLLMLILVIIFVLQIIFLTFCGPAIRVVKWVY